MTDSCQQLQGTLFATSRKGYENQGRQSLVFPAKLNYLPVYSRCNELLRSEKDSDQEENPKLTEVHCSSLSISKNKIGSISKDKFQQSVTLLKKSIKASEENTSDFQLTQRKDKTPEHECSEKSHDLTESKTQYNCPKATEGVSKFTPLSKNIGNQAELLKQLEKQRLERLNLEKEYNVLLQQAIDHKFNLKKENAQSEEKEGRHRGKISFVDSQRAKTKMHSEEDEQDEENDNVTQFPKYKNFSNEKRIVNEGRILEELAQINDKINGLDVQMRLREEKMKREILEREVQSKNKEIDRIHLRSISSRNPENIAEQRNTSFNYFVLFLLGLLFTKAFLC